jgi:protein gp37
MADRSGIEWTEATWNPVTGCSKVSPGCAHCYAETQQPLRWRRPRLVFVNSMSDLFHELVPLAFIRHVFDVMEEADQHTFQILTKQANCLARLAPELEWPSNVWIGVSIENKRWLGRADCLREVPAAVRFISAVPRNRLTPGAQRARLRGSRDVPERSSPALD